MSWLRLRIAGGRRVAVSLRLLAHWRRRTSDRRQQARGKPGWTDQDIRYRHVGLVVDQGRAIDPGGVQAGRTGDGYRRRRVPLILTARVDVGVVLAPDDSSGLGPG